MYDWEQGGRDGYLCVGLDQALELAGIRHIAILLLQPPQRDLCPEALGHSIELLVGRVDADDMVARPNQGVEGDEVGNDGALSDKHVLSGERLGIGGTVKQ